MVWTYYGSKIFLLAQFLFIIVTRLKLFSRKFFPILLSIIILCTPVFSSFFFNYFLAGYDGIFDNSQIPGYFIFAPGGSGGGVFFYFWSSIFDSFIVDGFFHIFSFVLLLIGILGGIFILFWKVRSKTKTLMICHLSSLLLLSLFLEFFSYNYRSHYSFSFLWIILIIIGFSLKEIYYFISINIGYSYKFIIVLILIIFSMYNFIDTRNIESDDSFNYISFFEDYQYVFYENLHHLFSLNLKLTIKNNNVSLDFITSCPEYNPKSIYNSSLFFHSNLDCLNFYLKNEFPLFTSHLNYSSHVDSFKLFPDNFFNETKDILMNNLIYDKANILLVLTTDTFHINEKKLIDNCVNLEKLISYPRIEDVSQVFVSCSILY